MRAAARGDRSGRAPGRRRSEAALGTQPTQASTSADLVVLQGLLAAFEAHGSALAWAIDLAADVACDAGEPTGHLPATLRAMSRYLDFAYLAKTTDRPQLDAMIEGRTNTRMAEPPSPSGNLTSVRAWRKWLEERPGRSPSPNLDALVEEAWPRWEGRIARLFDGVTTLNTHIFYDDLVLAAADRMPSRVMRADLHQMKPIDWSELALFGSNSHPPAATSPHWSLLAGLRQLGFGGNLLAEILRVFTLDVGRHCGRSSRRLIAALALGKRPAGDRKFTHRVN